MVVPRPIAGFLVVEVDALAEFVVVGDVLLTVVRIIVRVSRQRRRGNERKVTLYRCRPCRLRNHAVGKNAVGGGGTACEAVRLALADRVAQARGKDLRPVSAVDTPGQSIRIKVACKLVNRW